MNSNLDYALASARAAELQGHVCKAREGRPDSLSARVRRRREAARRARARRSSWPRLRAA